MNHTTQTLQEIFCKLLSSRNLPVVTTKHFSDRVIERRIDIVDVAKILKKVCDNICLILYYVELNDGEAKVNFGNYAVVFSRSSDKFARLTTIYKPYKNVEREYDLYL